MKYNIKNVGGEILNLGGPLDCEAAKQLADEIEAEHNIDVVLVEVAAGKYYRFEWTIDHPDGRRIVDGNVGFFAQSPESAREFADELFSATDLKDGWVWTYNITCSGDE